MKGLLRSKFVLGGAMLLLIATLVTSFMLTNTHLTYAAPRISHAASMGGLDCNGFSLTGQKAFLPPSKCTDPRGPNGQRLEDNGHYLGHDEPAVQFNSQAPGSGNNVQYMLTLPREHHLPATQTFENQIAFWLSMALCDPGSFPQAPCKPDTDQNPNQAGSAFLEMQFYPPGFAPFISQISCDTTHWCASLHINSLECTAGFAMCNNDCLETTNFAFIQMDGVPTGPAGPAVQTAASFTPNAQTLLMNQGDRLKITINDTPGDINGGVTTRIDDLSTGKSGFMIASAAHQFQSLNVNDCSPTNFSFHPEYSTARFGNFVPWAALQANIGFSSEIGHFEVGTGDSDDDDAPCFTTSPTSILAGCIGSDLDFDGTSYQADWPDGTSHTATSLKLSSPRSASNGSSNYHNQFPIIQYETDVLASETSCQPDGSGCVLPPPGASFYPFYSVSGGDRDAFSFFGDGGCSFEFGNLTHGVNDFGKDAQYGTSNLPWFFGTASSGPMANPCLRD
ncbi:MAG TPA: hypothetical protein VFV38_42835 [Ktedonobacteraceae bacterium]|nr:hypothetical protein [Ktedonobacteraceae bacterium]